MELKEGMYVRTKYNDFCNMVAIRKIVEIDEEDNKFWVDDYIIDTYGDSQNKLCKEDISASLFLELLISMKRNGSRHAYEYCRKDLPILLISGKDDPVGDMSKGVQIVYKEMIKEGYIDVHLELLEHARHDVLHEHASRASLKAISKIIEFIK